MAIETIHGHFSCDNCYAIYLGDENGVTRRILPVPSDPDRGVVNRHRYQIFDGESVTFDAETGEWFYIIAWSDLNINQGLVGTFSGTETIHTGHPSWEVLATGHRIDDWANPAGFPKVSEINGYVTAASASDWKTPHNGPINNDTPVLYGGSSTPVNNVAADAHWIWHAAAPPNHPQDPFIGGRDAGEFLIFRIPAWEFASALHPDAKDCGCKQTVNVHCGSEAPAACCPPGTEATQAYDIYMSRIRLLETPQKDGTAELMVTGYANGQSGILPGMGTYFVLDTDWGWRTVSKQITTVQAQKGQRVDVFVSADAISADTTSAGRWNIGSTQRPAVLRILPNGESPRVVLQVQCLPLRPSPSRRGNCLLEVEFTAVPSFHP